MHLSLLIFLPNMNIYSMVSMLSCCPPPCHGGCARDPGLCEPTLQGDLGFDYRLAGGPSQMWHWLAQSSA